MSVGEQVATKSKNQKDVPVSLITETKDTLRTAMLKDENFPQLVDAVAKQGIMQPLLLRETRDADGKLLYGVIDGRQRLEAAKLAGLAVVPALIKNMSDGEVLVAQIVANAARIDTLPAQYAKQMKRILDENPSMTINDMSALISQTPAWIKKRLKIADLPDKITILVDAGDITLANAEAMVDLTKLAPDEVDNFLDRAQTAKTPDFAAQVKERTKQIREAHKKGRDPEKKNEFVAQPLLRAMGEIRDEYYQKRNAAPVLEAMNAKSPLDGWNCAFEWCMRHDPLSQEEGRKKFEHQLALNEEEKRKKKAERDEKAALKAAENTATVTETA